MKFYVKINECNFVTASDRQVLDLAREVAMRRLRRDVKMGDPVRVARMVADRIGSLESEVFCVAFLDTRHKLIEWREMFQGTINGASVHPREVVKAALELNAAAVILAHNHPSGNTEPSQADEMITSRLKEALALIDCQVLDHIIAAGSETTSFTNRGLI